MSTKSWPADKVERRKTASLIPYARNARTHTAAQVAQIAASVREWGWTAPVLVSEDGTIIAGHGRVLAAQSLGLDEVPVMVAVGWTEAQRRAYTLADNRLALSAGWHDEMLRLELSDLKDFDFPLELIGFEDGELLRLLDPGKALGDMPGLPDGDRSEYGQISFILHRTQIEEVERALASAKAMSAQLEEGEGEAPVNKNTNGNALALIASSFITHNGGM